MHVHSALLVSTTCQRLGLGLYIFSVLANQFMGVPLPMNMMALIALVLLGIGGIASAFHLGRPARFFNAFSNFGSHLTQEAAMTPFLGIALLLCIFNVGGVVMQWISLILAIAFLISTGLVYQLNARPAWNTSLVLIVFMATAAQIGTLATVAAGFALNGEVSTSLLVVTGLMFVICLVVQYLFIQRLHTLKYGVAVNVTDAPYKSAFVTWLVFGALAIAVCLAAAVAGVTSFAYLAVLCSVVGILAWTILFYKVALKAKMFPMYPVELNVYM